MLRAAQLRQIRKIRHEIEHELETDNEKSHCLAVLAPFFPRYSGVKQQPRRLRVLRIKSALAIGLILGLTSLTASAGDLSYESRGYGGPLYIGPNFQQGGQHSAPTYGSESGSSSSYRSTIGRSAKSARRATSPRRKSPEHETVTEKAPAEKSAPAERSRQPRPPKRRTPTRERRSRLTLRTPASRQRRAPTPPKSRARRRASPRPFREAASSTPTGLQALRRCGRRDHLSALRLELRRLDPHGYSRRRRRHHRRRLYLSAARARCFLLTACRLNSPHLGA